MKCSTDTQDWDTVDRENFKSILNDMIRIDDLETRDYQFERVNNAHDFFTALKLVQDVYVQQGYVDRKTDPRPCRILKQHHHKDSVVFIGKKFNQITYTVSLFPDSKWDLPMDLIYKKEMDKLRAQGRKIGEVGCLATHPNHRTGSQNILMHGNKIMVRYAMETLELDDLVIVVHPKHALVYTEVLLFEEISSGTVKNYSKVNNNPAVALRLNLQEIEEKFWHYYHKNPIETNLHHFLFVKNSSNMDIPKSPQSGIEFWNELAYQTW